MIEVLNSEQKKLEHSNNTMLSTVKNEIFYHVSRGGNWQENALYFIGDKENYYYQKLMNQNFPPITKEDNPFIPSSLEGAANFDNVNQRLSSLEAQIRFYQVWIREKLLEQVRKEHFPDRPSRFRAMWVIPNQKESMTYWLPKMKAPDAKIMKVELSGNLHRAPQKLLAVQTSSAAVKEKNAYAYWLGNFGENTLDDECIFQGFMRVVEIIQAG